MRVKKLIVDSSLLLLMMAVVITVFLTYQWYIGVAEELDNRTVFIERMAVEDEGILTEELAMRFAMRGLKHAGYNLDEWQPFGESPSVGPNESDDCFLFRNQDNPNRGFIHFRRESAATDRVRHVYVELIQDEIVVTGQIPK